MFFVVIFYRCFSEPCSLTYLEIFIDTLMTYIILDWNIYSVVSIIFLGEPVVYMFSKSYLVCLV